MSDEQQKRAPFAVTYRSIKTVRAVPFVKVEERDDGSGLLIGPDGRLEVSAEYMRRHQPKPPGYWVQYIDGYESWSPVDAFRSGNVALYGHQAAVGAAPGHRGIDDEILHRFSYHPPRPELKQAERYQSLRTLFRILADDLVRAVPPGRELSLALTKLEEASMHANSGIARNE